MTKITKDTNSSLHHALTAVMAANKGAVRINYQGTEYRAYDRGDLFIPLGQSAGLPYYDNLSMSGPNTNAPVEQGTIEIPAPVAAKNSAAEIPAPKASSKKSK